MKSPIDHQQLSIFDLSQMLVIEVLFLLSLRFLIAFVGQISGRVIHRGFSAKIDLQP